MPNGRSCEADCQLLSTVKLIDLSNQNRFISYAAVTVAYWSFMLTDGALRMLVLLHFHTLGFSPIQLAYLFLLYEAMGIIANVCLLVGWVRDLVYASHS